MTFSIVLLFNAEKSNGRSCPKRIGVSTEIPTSAYRR